VNAEFWRGRTILVTGGGGFIGSHLVDVLRAECGVEPSAIRAPRSRDCDLRDPAQCRAAMKDADIVLHLAAVTGGIGFSRAHPASQYHDSTLIDLNVFRAAREAGVSKVVAIGNLFAYAGDAPVPLSEGDLFDGLPTDAHRGVGWLKRNLGVVADLYRREHEFPIAVVYSANAYGPRDSTDLAHAHVIPSTILKCLTQKEVVVWGDGRPTRDFLHATDVARGIILAAERLDGGEYVNLGSGREVSIRQLVELITELTGFTGAVKYDVSKSGGDARRLTDVARARERLGFTPMVELRAGLSETVAWYRAQVGQVAQGAAR
jgi:GDP-L-fucose synthase